MVVHNKFYDDQALSLMIDVSSGGVGSHIHKNYILIILSWTLQHGVLSSQLTPRHFIAFSILLGDFLYVHL
jgi:hypothetical protein